ncbi:tRNA pseudouridine synthase D (TruD) [Gracilaria domingensis]|nr:tRNA pseudouridine synthase D (TruD) [Gracilaria domingensis]
MPVTEADVAITERLSAHKPFRAVLKQTVDDFIVNEISQNNHVLTLSTLPRTTPKRPRPPPLSPSDIPFSQVDQLFPSHDPPPSAALSSAITQTKSSHSFPVLKDKESRTKLHQWVREYLPSYIGDTLQTDEGQVIRIRPRSATRPWKRRRKNGDAGDNTYDPREHHNDYEDSFPRNSLVNFVLWKKNRDTTEALTLLSKVLSRNVKNFFYAGTKDKRAVTTQLVQIRGVQERDLARANSKLLYRDHYRPSVLVGNVSLATTTKSSHLRLGDLKGNRFTLVLRDAEKNCDDSLETASNSIRQVGFINYFGLQRFGSGVSPTHETGFALLRADFKEVCRRLLLPLRIGEDETKMNPDRKRFVQALDKFANDEITATQLLPELAPWQRIERSIVESLAHDEKKGVSVPDYRKAFGRLPRFLRMMYGHAVQSYLWNVMASERIRLSRPDPNRENMHAIEGDIIAGADSPEGELSFKTKVRQVTKEEEKSKSISVHRVLIPVLGSEIQMPSVPYASKVQKILEAEKLDFKAQARSEYQVKGTYRRLLSVPKDFESKFVSYSDKREIVVPSQVEALVAELKDRKPTSPQANGSKKGEGSNQAQRIEDKMDVERMNGESGVVDDIAKQSKGEERKTSPKEHEGDNSNCAAKESSKQGKENRKEMMNDQRKEESSAAETVREDAEEDAEIQNDSDEGIRFEPANVCKDDNSAQSKEEGKVHKNNAGVQMEGVGKYQGGDQTKEASEAKAVKRAGTSNKTRTGHGTSAEVEGERGTGSQEQNKEGVDCNATVSIPQAVSTAERTGGDGVGEVQKSEGNAVPRKVVKELDDKQMVLVEDASHDKAEDASGEEVVPHLLSATTEDGVNLDREARDPSVSQGKGDHGGGESRRALVISFSLGCAEYATMLVRELTGNESSTAAQKALERSV